MGIIGHDPDEIVTLAVQHPSQALELAGRSFVTPWFTMDAARSESFEFASYMDGYAHPYGGGEGYGDDLVEGFHLLSMTDFLLNQALWSEGPWIAWNYGLDRVRFVSVVRRSDPLRLRGTVREVVDRGAQGHLLVIDLIGEVKDRERPGFTATLRALWTTNE
ncbi:hypothetical protein [Streptomyces canus]|uniref:hypothetical protein n=1 Tax=Streptomyces canus TaxID=58343 RepID=UPI003711B294